MVYMQKRSLFLVALLGAIMLNGQIYALPLVPSNCPKGPMILPPGTGQVGAIFEGVAVTSAALNIGCILLKMYRKQNQAAGQGFPLGGYSVKEVSTKEVSTKEVSTKEVSTAAPQTNSDRGSRSSVNSAATKEKVVLARVGLFSAGLGYDADPKKPWYQKLGSVRPAFEGFNVRNVCVSTVTYFAWLQAKQRLAGK